MKHWTLLAIYAKIKIVGDKFMVKARIKSAAKQDISAFVLITSITGVVSALAMYFVLSSSLIVGWDTPIYLYRTHVLIESGLQRFLEVSYYGSNGMLYYFLLYALYFTTGQSLLLLEKIVPSILFGMLVITPALVAFVWTRKTHIALICLLFTIVWPAPYILASNLHSNLLGFFFVLLALAFVPSGFFSSMEAYLALILLMIMASLSHPVTALYFGLIIALGVSMTMFSNARRKILSLKVILLLVASSAEMILHVFISGSMMGYGPLFNPGEPQAGGVTIVDVTWGLKLVGYTLLPIVLISILITLNKIVQLYKMPSDNKELVSYSLVLAWATSILLFWFLSYFIPVLPLYVDRLLILFPSPFLITFLFAMIWGDLSQ
jgi:hypothetical protein